MINETRTLEEKVNKAMIDATCLADELRAKQKNTQHEQRKRQSLDCDVQDMQVKSVAAEQLAVKGGKQTQDWDKRFKIGKVGQMD